MVRVTNPKNPKTLLKLTWNKLWAKQWLQQNTDIVVPSTYVFSETWENLVRWLNSDGCPIGKRMVIKPLNLSLSRGVRVLIKNADGTFLTVLGESKTFKELSETMLQETVGHPLMKWFVEEYVEPVPKCMSELCYDLPEVNPLLRIMMMRGEFHFGEVHVPTKVSNGRGTLKGGARRLAFNYKGELYQERPPVATDSPWRMALYGTKIDVTGMVVPGIEELVQRIKTQVCSKMGRGRLFSVDGCYRDTPKGPEFVCVEIEHVPTVGYLAKFEELRRPVDKP